MSKQIEEATKKFDLEVILNDKLTEKLKELEDESFGFTETYWESSIRDISIINLLFLGDYFDWDPILTFKTLKMT